MGADAASCAAAGVAVGVVCRLGTPAAPSIPGDWVDWVESGRGVERGPVADVVVVGALGYDMGVAPFAPFDPTAAGVAVEGGVV